MNIRNIAYLLLLLPLVFACTKRDNVEKKGFEVYTNSSGNNEGDDEKKTGFTDTLKFATKPTNVLLTGVPNVRLVTVYKVNTTKGNRGTTFTGSNGFHYLYEGEENKDKLNNWNGNLVPGLQAVYGFNLVNAQLYNLTDDKRKLLFEKPVLIKTIYYPSFTKDTLNGQPVLRNYILVSAYNEDSNKDNFINLTDLRHLYLFDINGNLQKQLIPNNYSVYKSEYDKQNDMMYVFAYLDENNSGTIESTVEPTHIFWINLKDPTLTGKVY